MIGKTISHYKVLEKLGEGGMGVVYKAEDTKLKRIVALKFLSSQSLGTPGEKTRFVHEAQAAAALDHPNICTVYEIDEADGHTFITMAYIDGLSLREKTRSGPLRLEEALSFATDIARGLQEAHEKNIVHRDIKSANVMVTTKGQAKITDFGLAKLGDSTRVTKTGTTVGTVAYMSPEQARGEDVDRRSDIWALGVVLYEMLTGRLPFESDHAQALTYQILHEDPDPITAIRTGIPMELERIANKCLEKESANRYQHVDEVLVDLRRVKKALTQRPGKKPVKSRQNLVKLAVLPIENLGAPEDEYFADGITDEITSKLAVIPGLAVISRTSAKKYKNTDKGLREIGKELGVDYVLEGTIRWDKSGGLEKVRITPQLIDVSEDTHLWAENYEREIEEIFAVQADIASQIAEALDITLLGSERQTIEARPTGNIAAYQAYLRGLDYTRVRGDDYRLAIQMFERAVELDPEFALSYAELSVAHSYLYNAGYDQTEDRRSRAKAAVDEALALQPELPEAHRAMAYYYYHGYRDYERALEELAIARRGLPNDSRIIEVTAFIWRCQGKFEAALDRMKEAFELSPQDALLTYEIGLTNWFLRRHAEADRYCDLSISLAPDQLGAYGRKAYNYVSWLGDTKRAQEVLDKMPRQGREVQERCLTLWRLQRNYQAILDFASSAPEPVMWRQVAVMPVALLAAKVHRLTDEPELARASFESSRTLLARARDEHPDDHRIHSALGICYAGLGRKDEAIREGKRGVELLPVSEDARIGIFRVWDLAETYTMVGEYDAALTEIEYLLSIPAGWSVQDLRLDPLWDPLREHPRYQALLEKYAID